MEFIIIYCKFARSKTLFFFYIWESAFSPTSITIINIINTVPQTQFVVFKRL